MSWFPDRARTPAPASPSRPAPAGEAARSLAHGLAGLRRANGLSQPGLAALTGYSVTTIGHAETGRLWQAREFWEKADDVLGAGGELAALHDAYRTEAADPATAIPGEPTGNHPGTDAPAALTHLTLHWSDGTATTLHPPQEGKG